MGGGSFTRSDYTAYSAVSLDGLSAREIYTARNLDEKYDPKNIQMRESRDSDEHPNSSPIIIGVDVTGSMNNILEFVAKSLGDTVLGIMNETPIEDPQVMFIAIGDSAANDQAPLQATQFESDIRIAEQLTDLWFEGRGGGNNFESYPLAWWFAKNRTSTDSFEKRGQKGFIFTMGDDGFPEEIHPSEIYRVFGEDVSESVNVRALLEDVKEQYEVFHFCLRQGSNAHGMRTNDWTDLMGERAIMVDDYHELPELITSLLQTVANRPGEATIVEMVPSVDDPIGDAL